MKIATWNIERFKHRKYSQEMLNLCHSRKADIMVLTETDREFNLDYTYAFHTPCLSEAPLYYPLPTTYRNSENRVSIYTRYPCLEMYDTYDKFTSLSVKLKTELGDLIIYGTIAGITGNRSPSFNAELKMIINDIERISHKGNICICGDFNCSFIDNYYFTNYAKDTYLKFFSRNNIHLLTKDTLECIDHIAISDEFLRQKNSVVYEWNLDKSFSDHKGIILELR